VIGHVRLGRRGKPTGCEFRDRVSHRTRASDDDADSVGGKGLVSVRPAVAGENVPDAFLGHELRRLDARASAKAEARIRDRLEAHVVCLHDQKIGASAEARVDCPIEGRISCGHRNLHEYPPFLGFRGNPRSFDGSGALRVLSSGPIEPGRSRLYPKFDLTPPGSFCAFEDQSLTSSTTPAAAGPLLFSRAARHEEANIRQLPPQKSGDDRLQIATDETYNLNTRTHKGRLEGVGERPAEKDCCSESGDLL
jgi:hypothetical protein